jgi:uncharacterized repeat protein (TIGR03803 family)
VSAQRTRTLALVLPLLLAAGWPQSAPAHKAKLRTLHSFCAESGCADGREPSAGLIADGAGNLYGTTLFGGDADVGVAFELTPNARKTKYKYKRLYSFCAQASCADGNDPDASLIIDASGNLYGTTMAGGANDGGVVFELKPGHGTWTYTVLYSFCASADCADGREPQSSLSYVGKESGAPYDGSSPLYGTASQAGANKQGVAFKLTPGAPLWTEQVLYAFCAVSGCTDGAGPVTGLTVDGSGHLFGTTYYGGDANMGTVFALSGGTLTVLHSFCASANCADGAFPAAAMHLDAQGNLLGTTFGGGKKGKNCVDIGVGGCGTAFKLSPDAEIALYKFCAKKNCVDGSYPLAGVLPDAPSGLWGATLYGGGNGDSPGAGTIFKLNGGEQSVYRFCAQADCSDGENPEGDLIMDASGNVFGTTLFAGANGGGGTVFELMP